LSTLKVLTTEITTTEADGIIGSASLFCHGTGASTRSEDIKLALWAQISLFSGKMRS
jgi:hypothetical protein